MAIYQTRPSIVRRRPLLLQSLLIASIFILLFRYPGLDLELSFPIASLLLPQCLHSSKSPPLKYAYATLLLSSSNTTSTTSSAFITSSSSSPFSDSLVVSSKQNEYRDSDPYFTSTLLLTHQLLHSSTTRTKKSIPFLILHDYSLPVAKKQLLTLLGATLIEVSPVLDGLDWMKPLRPHWGKLTTKLRLFELSSWDRILFLDADTFLLGNMDGVFTDTSSIQPSKTRRITTRKKDEAPLPPTYLFASLPEVLHTSHPTPPHPWGKFNAGFFLLQPSAALFNYYISLLRVEEKFDSMYAEQALLNYAHREEGNMPWGRLGWWGWNMNRPNWKDVRKGVRSVHVRLWGEAEKEGKNAEWELERVDGRLKRMWRAKKEEMETWVTDRGGKLGWELDAEVEREREMQEVKFDDIVLEG